MVQKFLNCLHMRDLHKVCGKHIFWRTYIWTSKMFCITISWSLNSIFPQASPVLSMEAQTRLPQPNWTVLAFFTQVHMLLQKFLLMMESSCTSFNFNDDVVRKHLYNHFPKSSGNKNANWNSHDTSTTMKILWRNAGKGKQSLSRNMFRDPAVLANSPGWMTASRFAIPAREISLSQVRSSIRS